MAQAGRTSTVVHRTEGRGGQEKEKGAQLEMHKWLRPRKVNAEIEGKRSESGPSAGFSSHAFYNNLWADTMKQVRLMLAEEKGRGVITGSDRRKMFQTIVEVYYKYLKIYKTMDLLYDQMVHPQKRIVVRKLLDLLIGRLLELKTQLVICENAEICYFDELAMSEGVVPKEIDMPIPTYYYHDPTPEMIQRDQWFVNVEDRARRQKEKEEEMQRRLQAKLEAEVKWNQLGANEDEDIDDDSVISVQVMERARQGKGRYIIAKYLYEEEIKSRRKKAKGEVTKLMDPDKAATIIQKLVRGFLGRQRVKVIRNNELEFLGVRPTAISKQSPFGLAKLESKRNAVELANAKEKRRNLRRVLQKQYADAQVTIFRRLQVIEGPEMAERFKYQIRTWMINVKEATGKFPDLPKGGAGGLGHMILPDSLPAPDQIREKSKDSHDPETATKNKKDGQKQKEKEKKEKAKVKAKAKKAKGPGVADNPVLEAPKYFNDFKAANLDYNMYWRGSNDKENPEQRHEDHHIIREKRELVAQEVREQVDIAMKAELEYMKQVLEKKKGKKGKKGKGKGKKGKGKGKKGKKGKKKKGKDLTPDRTMESLFEELVNQNIIHQYPKIRMNDLIGQCSFINGELRTYHTAHPFEKKTEERYMPGDANPIPAFGDVLRAVKDICILPMGSVEVHKMSPTVTKSVLICGPQGSGKKTIVNMICTELRATLVDLTAANIAGKYPGKPGLKMLMHLLEKVGRAVQPVILLIDNCEKTYMKKVPKTDKTEPKRLKKQLGKFLKIITTEDLFLLIGLSSEPWICPFKAMKKDYQRVIYVPPADYGTRLEVWRMTLTETEELLHPDINYSLLAKLTVGWTSGNIRSACADMVAWHYKDLAKRVKKRRKEDDPWAHLGKAVVRFSSIGKLSITMNKLIDCISEYDPVFMEQEKLWINWWNKTPLQKARLATQVKPSSDKKDKKGKKKKKRK